MKPGEGAAFSSQGEGGSVSPGDTERSLIFQFLVFPSSLLAGRLCLFFAVISSFTSLSGAQFHEYLLEILQLLFVADLKF